MPFKLGKNRNVLSEMAIYTNIDLLMFLNLMIVTILPAHLILKPRLISDMNIQDLKGTIEEAVARVPLALQKLMIHVLRIDLIGEMSVKRGNLQALTHNHPHAQRISQQDQEATEPIILQPVITAMAKIHAQRTHHQQQTRPMGG